MSDYKPKPGDITVFRNTKKTPNDNQPDYDGKGIDLNGNDVRIALWVKEGRNGKFFSGRLSTPRPPADQPMPPASASPPATGGGANDLPF